MTVEGQAIQSTSPGHAPPQTPPAGKRSWRGLLLFVAVLALVMGYVIYNGVSSRARANSALERSTVAMAVPTVSIVHPKVTAGTQEVVVPGNMQAFTDTPIWARASGYLKRWYVDIGGHVKTGQLLAEIESPEVDQQLRQAREDLATAEANLKLAQITADRYNDLFKTDSVSKQDVDNAVQTAAARTTTVKSAQANVSRLEQLVAYEKVYAPFDGVVTARNIDVGALIDAGANTPGKELFHLASTSTLRVYVNVPEAYERAARPGVDAYLTLTEFPGRQFHGTVVRNAEAIDPASRTLLVEVDVKNTTGELLPGSYASVHLKVPSKIQAVTVPVNTLLFRSEGLRVAIVRNGHAELVPVTIGRDFGEDVELVSGITADDSVIVNPSDSIASGQEVRVAGQGSSNQGS
ncbi:MAG: efflux RND transporter periplasmic adaptor subunit [Acidobacteriaceae bacterium]|nr:efflux RND transporter periplasmic adaptor subunit [Acidobacteriaceae bacterium]